MRVICSYCGFLYDLKEPFEDDSVSHGCCPECWPWVEHNLQIELESQNHLSGDCCPNLNPCESSPTGNGYGGVRQPKAT